MAIGQKVKAGQPLLRIENDLIDEAPLEKLRMEAEGLAERIAAMRKHLVALDRLKDEFERSANDYHLFSVNRLEHELEAARQASASADALFKIHSYKREQEQRLASSKSTTGLDLTKAWHNADSAGHKAKQTYEMVAKLEAELAAVRKGVYLGAGDGRADVPYSKQRIHDVRLKQIDIEATIQELMVRHAAVARQLRGEEQRVRQRTSHTVHAPTDGIIWRRHVNVGTRVAGQAYTQGGSAPSILLHLVNVKELFIDAVVHEKYAGYIHTGDRVRIKFVGSEDEAEGVVKHVMGRGLAWDETLLAAEPPQADKREIHVLVAFSEMPQNPELEQYRIGHPVEVIFGDHGSFAQHLLSRLQMFDIQLPLDEI
jgi:multidrug resistance efflux pump